jgi:translation initiation factor 1 (eIF-1/SUI1)
MLRRSTREPLRRPPSRRRDEPRAEPAAEPPAHPHGHVLDLQHAAGNQAVGTLLRQPTVTAPAAKPKTDEEQWAEDWNDPAFASAKRHFEGTDRPKGTAKERYDVLCPLYRQQGIKRPLKYVHDNIVEVRFFGHFTYAHKDLKAALKTAEDDLKKNKGYKDAPFRKCWAFNPRTTSEGNWSNHADGKAIDIDEDTNPRLIKKQERAVITALTGIDVSAPYPGKDMGVDSYQGSLFASGLFQLLYSPTGMAIKIAVLEQIAIGETQSVEATKLELAGVPKGKGATSADKKRAKEIAKRVKALEAELAKTRAAQKVLTTEKARYEKLDVDIASLQDQVAKLVAELEQLAKDIAAATTNKAKGALIKTQTAKKQKLKKTLEELGAKRADPLRGYADKGFLDLNPDLVQALKDAGLHWGGEVWAGKDYMHFQVAPQ